MTLEESLSPNGVLANEIQLGWWTDPIRGSPSQFEELGIFCISDQGGSWINMMLKWVNNLRIVLTMREFFWTFCEKILRFLIIIGKGSYSLQNEKIWICWYRSQCISFGATPCEICASRTDISWSQLGDYHGSSNTWTNEDTARLSWFPASVGWS